MNIIELILVAVRSLSVIITNPALGGGSFIQSGEASELLDIFAELLARGEEGHEDLKAFAETVQAMADENRPPTKLEWETLRSRSDAAHQIIQDAAKDSVSDEEALETRKAELMNFTKDELIAKAEEVDVEFNTSMTKAEIVDAIIAMDEEPTE